MPKCRINLYDICHTLELGQYLNKYWIHVGDVGNKRTNTKKYIPKARYVSLLDSY